MRDMELNNPDSINLEGDLNILSKSVNPVRLKNNPVGIDEETAIKSQQIQSKLDSIKALENNISYLYYLLNIQ